MSCDSSNRKKLTMRSSKRWSGFRSVLCAVDFSALSQRALQYAEAVAGRGKAPLQVLYVNDPLLIAAAAAALHDWQLAKRSAGELRRFIDETVVAKMKQRPRVKSSVSMGNPSDEILKAVARNRADLIVLGTHGLTGADRLLMGSTTLSVLQRARVPVLAVPRATEGLTAPVSLSWPGPTCTRSRRLGAWRNRGGRARCPDRRVVRIVFGAGSRRQRDCDAGMAEGRFERA